ncbi:MAG: hypothetical protein P8N09_02760 [Planctomycetota bacterium]|nr:hypothetical protein [Planctomycetota bacterium]
MPSPRLNRLAPLLSWGVLSACLVLVFSRAMNRPLNHDEHQFIASATAWSREGLLPYRDFPHFHMPYLVFLYGALDDLFHRPFLTARTTSVFAAWLTMLLLYVAVLRSVDKQRPWAGHILGISAALLLLFNPLFTYTSGNSWNHDISVLLALGSFLLASRPGSAQRPLAAGLLLGIATGVRLSVAPLFIPLLWQVTRPHSEAKQRRPGSRLCLGLALGLLPALLLFMMAPERSFFGNLEYPALNTAFRADQGFERAMDFPGKLQYLLMEVLGQPGNLALLALLLFGCFCSPLRGTGETGDARQAPRRRLALLFILFLMAGAFGPTPSWYQYFYPLVPFAILIGLLGLGTTFGRPQVMWSGALLVMACILLSAQSSLPAYRTLSNLGDAESWTPSRLAATGKRIRAHFDKKPEEGPIDVLTFAPALPIEAGLRTDPAFASGSFAWRSAPFLAAEERVEQGLVGPEELDEHLAQNPPDAVLTEAEQASDLSLRAWAEARGFSSHELGDGFVLYVAP